MSAEDPDSGGAAVPSDDRQVIPLLRAALGKPDDPHYEGFLDWKHRQNALWGVPRRGWRCTVTGWLGYRTLLRWRFPGRGGPPGRRRCVAVDTATLPDYQGLGIFRTLTLRGVAELTLAGDGIVFNTPNDKSRPGYLKMGWSVVRRLPVGVLPAGPRALLRMASSRVASSIWSDPCDVGLDAAEALADSQTAWRCSSMPWRGGFAPTRRRSTWPGGRRSVRCATGCCSRQIMTRGRGIIFRLRNRGASTEAAVIEQLVPDRLTGARLITRMLKADRRRRHHRPCEPGRPPGSAPCCDRDR